MSTTFVPPRPSAAIRIVPPSAPSRTSSPVPSSSSVPSRDANKPSSKNKPPKCRNILIHGSVHNFEARVTPFDITHFADSVSCRHCKNEGKGCTYDHSVCTTSIYILDAWTKTLDRCIDRTQHPSRAQSRESPNLHCATFFLIEERFRTQAEASPKSTSVIVNVNAPVFVPKTNIVSSAVSNAVPAEMYASFLTFDTNSLECLYQGSRAVRDGASICCSV